MLEAMREKRFTAEQHKRLKREQAKVISGWVRDSTPWHVQPPFPAWRVFWGMMWRCAVIGGSVGGVFVAGHLLWH